MHADSKDHQGGPSATDVMMTRFAHAQSTAIARLRQVLDEEVFPNPVDPDYEESTSAEKALFKHDAVELFGVVADHFGQSDPVLLAHAGFQVPEDYKMPKALNRRFISKEVHLRHRGKGTLGGWNRLLERHIDHLVAYGLVSQIERHSYLIELRVTERFKYVYSQYFLTFTRTLSETFLGDPRLFGGE